MRNIVLAAGLALTLVLAGSPAAMAQSPDIDVDIRVPGVGGYGDPYDEDYSYRRRRVSCPEARRIVRDHGYRRVRTLRCGERRHTFEGFRRGRLWVLTVSARTGELSRQY
jgi:hypothetical protein